MRTYWRAVALFLGLCLLLAPWTNVCAQGTDGDPSDAEWTIKVNPDVSVQILHKGYRVAWMEHVTWAERRVWTMSVFNTTRLERGSGEFTGKIAGLDLVASGRIAAPAANQIQVEYDFTASRPHEEIYGAVLDWRFKLNSPTFAAPAPKPILLEDRTGWLWQATPTQRISVRFAEPLPKLIFEAFKNDEIRAFLYADRVSPGSRRVVYTVTLPEGGRLVPSDKERYGEPDRSTWFRDALPWDGSPIDLSFLNAQDRPAGKHGLVKADDDHLVYEDGTPARFWGGNLVATALIQTPRGNARAQARRIAKLGYNLMRIHQYDATWTNPNIFLNHGATTTRQLDPKALDAIDWWIKCLKDEGIYVMLDLVYGRELKPADGVRQGFDEITRQHGKVFGFCYFNTDVRELMREYQDQILSHVNPYTRMAYKDDPCIVGVQLTNENDLTHHFGNNMLPDKKNPVHNAVFTRDYKAFAARTGLPVQQVWHTWEHGPSKYFLADIENRFNQYMIEDLRRLGVRCPIITTNTWGEMPLSGLPALTAGDLIDVHSYGDAEALSANPLYQPNFVTWIAAAQVAGKPLSISEWNTRYPTVDRFDSPLYVASVASLQGWDMPMIYNYSQMALLPPGPREWEHKIDDWSTYSDPALCGVMPAAALAFRQGHISPARKHYYLDFGRDLLGKDISPYTSATLRTLAEQSKISIAIPPLKELPWLQPTAAARGATVVRDFNRSFLAEGEQFVRSDTGELLRNWRLGIQIIDAPRTQAAAGWIGGKHLRLSRTGIDCSTRKAVVAFTSVDNQPLESSHEILITTMARAEGQDPRHLPFLSEPVRVTATLATKVAGLELQALDGRGRVVQRLKPQQTADGISIKLPTSRGTHWYLLKAAG